MIKTIYSLLIAISFCVCGSVFAQEQSLEFNIALTSDYRSRGISQARFDPALQGGANYFHNRSGFYLGTWSSTIQWLEDIGGRGGLELDVYLGQRGTIGKEFSYDFGVATYIYPDNQLDKVPGVADANTTEIYGYVGYGWVYLKYLHAVTNLFGWIDSKNSGYLDLGVNIPLNKTLVLNLHAGHQSVKNYAVASYEDWKITLTQDFGICTLALAALGTNADDSLYISPANGKFLGRETLVITLRKVF